MKPVPLCENCIYIDSCSTFSYSILMKITLVTLLYFYVLNVQYITMYHFYSSMIKVYIASTDFLKRREKLETWFKPEKNTTLSNVSSTLSYVYWTHKRRLFFFIWSLIIFKIRSIFFIIQYLKKNWIILCLFEIN